MMQSQAQKHRSEQTHMISQGIKAGKISDADFLAIAVENRRKRQAAQENVPPKNKVSHPSPFDSCADAVAVWMSPGSAYSLP